MGIKDLTKLVEEEDIYTTLMTTLAGLIFAWDISCLLHVAISSREGADQYHSFPPVPVTAVVEAIDQVVGLFQSFNVQLIAVFDGVQHPMKARVSEKRAGEAGKRLAKLRDLWRRGNSDDYGEVQRLKKGCCVVRPDIVFVAVKRLRELGVRCLGSPFEAEWQCVMLQKQGLVQGILSKDSDVLALGGTNLLQKHKKRSVDGQAHFACSLLKREDVLHKLGDKVGADVTPHGFLALCQFLGNDYILRVKNNGIAECLKLTADYMSLGAGDHVNFFKRFEVDEKGRKRKFNEKGGDVIDYENFFTKAYNLFKYAPVFVSGDGDSVAISSLNPLPDGASWEALVGFDPHALYGGCGVSCYDAFTMAESCRYGKGSMQSLPLPAHPYEAGKTCGHGQVLDFERCPVELCTPRQLWYYLHCRYMQLPESVTRNDLVSLTNRLIETERESGDARPIRANDGDDAPKYVPWEYLRGRGESGSVSWVSGDEALCLIRDALPVIDESLIVGVFGEGREGVKKRAMLRLQAGHFNIQSLRYGLCEVEGTRETVSAIECFCTPSLKSDEYNVRIVFGDDKKPSTYYSYCDCPDGLHFCSHLLALFLLLKVLQIQPEWNIATMKRILPEPIKTIQSLPLAVDYVYRVLVERDKLVQETTAEKGKRWKARSEDGGTGVICRALSAEHRGYSTDDQTDDPAVERAAFSEPDPVTPSSLSAWVEENSLERFRGLAERLGSIEALCRLPSSGVLDLVRFYNMGKAEEAEFRKAIKKVQRVNLCSECEEFVQSLVARASSENAAGSGSMVGSSAVNKFNDALRKSPLDDASFVKRQSASLNRLLALVRSGACDRSMLSDYAEWEEFVDRRRRVLSQSDLSKWADVSKIAIPEHLKEFVNTGGAAQRRARARKDKDK